MTTKKAYPYTYTQKRGGKFVEFRDLKKIKNINSSYAQSVEVMKGKKVSPNRPSTLTLSNWKAGIPTGSSIQKVTIYYQHQKIPKTEGKYPNIGAPTIDVLYKGKSIVTPPKKAKNDSYKKGKAPTKNQKTEKITFNINCTVAQINSTDFQVMIDYPTNANDTDGYMRIYYVYMVITYKTANFGVSLKKSKGGYNHEEYDIRCTVSNKNPTGYNPKLLITSPPGFTYLPGKSKGTGKIRQIDTNTFEWTPKMSKRVKSNNYVIAFHVDVTYPSNQDFYDGVFRISENLNGHYAEHTAHITDRPKTLDDDTQQSKYYDDDTQSQGDVDSDPNKQTAEADYTVPVTINDEHIYLNWLPYEWYKQIIAAEGVPFEKVAAWNYNIYFASDIPVTWKIGTPDGNGHVDPNKIWNQGTGTGGIWQPFPYAQYANKGSICAVEIRCLRQCRANIQFKISMYMDVLNDAGTQTHQHIREGFAGGGLFEFVVTEEQKATLGLPYYTTVELTKEEKDRLCDGHNYTVQSYIRGNTVESIVRDYGENFRVIVFNNQIGTPITIRNIDEENNTNEIIEYDPTDYDALSYVEMYNNAEYKGTSPLTANVFESTECEFTYNEKYPLVIFITGDFISNPNIATLDFTEPCIIETDRYDGYETKGNYPGRINDLILNDGSSAEQTIPANDQSEDIIFSRFPLDEGYGTDKDLAIRGVGLEFNIEKTDTLMLAAKLKSDKGETGSRSVVIQDSDTNLDSTYNVEIGGLGDFWGFNTEDLVNLEDWQVELTSSNTLIDTEAFLNYGNVKLILYTETIEAQDVQTIINGDDIASYGVYLSDQKIPQGLNTDTNYLNANGTDLNEPSNQAIREKTIELTFAVNSCDVTTSTDMLRQVVQLLMTHRNEYNKPIPKRIEFSNYPDLFWEYILEDTFDAEIEISDYTVKAKLVVPAGTAYKKEPTVTNNMGFVQGITAVKPTITIKTTTEDTIEITEVKSEQTFNMGFTGDWENHLVEIDCENRIVWLKETEDDMDPINISRYVDINSDWFRLLGEYEFETSNCTLYTVEYTERW